MNDRKVSLLDPSRDRRISLEMVSLEMVGRLDNSFDNGHHGGRNIISDHVREIVPRLCSIVLEDKIGGRIGNGWKTVARDR